MLNQFVRVYHMFTALCNIFASKGAKYYNFFMLKHLCLVKHHFILFGKAKLFLF